MILKRERLQYKRGLVENEIFMFTANSTIRANGNLVMGAGCAKSVRDTYRGIDKLFGDKIVHLQEFNVTFVKWKEQWIGAFQTKLHCQKQSPMHLVKDGVEKLTRIANERPQWTFHLPCPAVNHGGQSVEDVLPLLEQLPDNVIVYLDK
jgi:hypothetical protein